MWLTALMKMIGVVSERGLADQRRRLKPVHPRHIHVEQDHREILLQQTARRLLAGGHFDDLLVQLFEQNFARQELIGTVVDDEMFTFSSAPSVALASVVIGCIISVLANTQHPSS